MGYFEDTYGSDDQLSAYEYELENPVEPEPQQELSVHDRWKQQSALDQDKFVENRGWISDTFSALGRSGLNTLSMGANAYEVISGRETGLDEWTERTKGNYDFFKQDSDSFYGEDGFFKRGWQSAFESILPSVSGSAPGAMAGAAAGSLIAPGPGTIVGGVLGGLFSLAAMFGAGTYGEEKKAGLEMGMSPEDAHDRALKLASVEAGGEMVAQGVGILAGPVMGKFMKTPVTSSLKNLLKITPKDLAKQFAGTAAAEVTTEVGQAVTQTKINESYGVEGASAWEAARESILPAILMSGFFFTGSQGYSAGQRSKLRAAVNSPNPLVRGQAIAILHKNISKQDAELGKDFMAYTEEVLATPGAKFVVDKDFAGMFAEAKENEKQRNAGFKANPETMAEASDEDIEAFISDELYSPEDLQAFEDESRAYTQQANDPVSQEIERQMRATPATPLPPGQEQPGLTVQQAGTPGPIENPLVVSEGTALAETQPAGPLVVQGGVAENLTDPEMRVPETQVQEGLQQSQGLSPEETLNQTNRLAAGVPQQGDSVTLATVQQANIESLVAERDSMASVPERVAKTKEIKKAQSDLSDLQSEVGIPKGGELKLAPGQAQASVDDAVSTHPVDGGSQEVTMTPTEFLNLTTTTKGLKAVEQTEYKEDETGAEAPDSLGQRFSNAQFTKGPAPYIVVNREGKVIAHEGRHRAVGARKEGVSSFPVVVIYSEANSSPTTITPQYGKAIRGKTVSVPPRASKASTDTQVSKGAEVSSTGQGDTLTTPSKTRNLKRVVKTRKKRKPSEVYTTPESRSAEDLDEMEQETQAAKTQSKLKKGAATTETAIDNTGTGAGPTPVVSQGRKDDQGNRDLATNETPESLYEATTENVEEALERDPVESLSPVLRAFVEDSPETAVGKLISKALYAYKKATGSQTSSREIYKDLYYQATEDAKGTGWEGTLEAIGAPATMELTEAEAAVDGRVKVGTPLYRKLSRGKKNKDEMLEGAVEQKKLGKTVRGKGLTKTEQKKWDKEMAAAVKLGKTQVGLVDRDKAGFQKEGDVYIDYSTGFTLEKGPNGFIVRDGSGNIIDVVRGTLAAAKKKYSASTKKKSPSEEMSQEEMLEAQADLEGEGAFQEGSDQVVDEKTELAATLDGVNDANVFEKINGLSGSIVTRAMSKYLEKIAKSVGFEGFEIQVKAGYSSMDPSGSYDRSLGKITIFIPEAAILDAKTAGEFGTSLANVMLHEMNHALTVHGFSQNPEIALELESLMTSVAKAVLPSDVYKVWQSFYKPNDTRMSADNFLSAGGIDILRSMGYGFEEFTAVYGLLDVMEFSSSVYTSPGFAETLKGVKVQEGARVLNGLQKFIETVTKSLGLKSFFKPAQVSAYEALMAKSLQAATLQGKSTKAEYLAKENKLMGSQMMEDMDAALERAAEAQESTVVDGYLFDTETGEFFRSPDGYPLDPNGEPEYYAANDGTAILSEATGEPVINPMSGEVMKLIDVPAATKGFFGSKGPKSFEETTWDSMKKAAKKTRKTKLSYKLGEAVRLAGPKGSIVMSSQQALDAAIKDSTMSRESQDLAKALLATGKLGDIPIVFLTDRAFTEGVSGDAKGQYLTESGEIAIRKSAMKDGATMLHEIVHGLTSNAIKSDPVLRAEVQAIHQSYKNQLVSKGIFTQEQVDSLSTAQGFDQYDSRRRSMDLSPRQEALAYSLYNEREFLSEIFGNSTVLAVTKSMDGQGQSLASRLWDSIKKSLGIQETSLASEGFDKIMSIAQGETAPGVAGAPELSPRTKEEWKAYAESRAAETPDAGSRIAGITGNLKKAGAYVSQFLEPVADAINRISPKISQMLNSMEARISMKNAEYGQEFEEFYSGYKKLSAVDQKTLNYYWANYNNPHQKELLDELLELHGMTEGFNKTQAILLDIGQRYDEIGMNPFGNVENYLPRKVRDVKGLMAWLDDHPEDTGPLSEIMKDPKLTPEEQDIAINALANSLSSGRIPSSALKLPSSVKERSIKAISMSMLKFYQNPIDTVRDHIQEANEAIETRAFVGKTKRIKLAAELREAYNSRVAAEARGAGDKEIAKLQEREDLLNTKYEGFIDEVSADTVSEVVYENHSNLSPEDQETLIHSLRARLNQKGMSGGAGGIRDIGLMASLGDVISTITQFADPALAMSQFGIRNTLSAIFQNKLVSPKEMDLTGALKEFQTQGLSKYVSGLLKATGFEATDRFFKGVSMQAGLKASSQQSQGEFLKSWGEYYGEAEALQVYNEVQAAVDGSGEVTDSVRLHAFHQVSKINPVSLSQMPARYLTAGNGRIFYTLKSYNIKALAMLRREGFAKMAVKGTRKEGLIQVVKLAALIVAAGVGTDELKEWLLGKDSTLSDKVHENLLGILMVSSYTLEQTQRSGVGAAGVASFLVPPGLTAFDPLMRDIFNLVNPEKEATYKTLKETPIAGRWLYSLSAQGKQATLDREKKALYSRLRDSVGGGEDYGSIRKDINKYNRKAGKAGIDKITAKQIRGVKSKYRKKLREQGK